MRAQEIRGEMQIEVRHLVKEYKRKKAQDGLLKALGSMFRPEYEILRAVDDVSFTIRRGEAVGYVGANGSGKSTTIKMLSGILTPTGGSVRVNGRDPVRERIENNREIGVVFGNRSILWWDVPVIESFRLLQRLYEIPEERFQANLSECKKIMGIDELLHVPERQLSLGQKMRCNIAGAFLHDPKIVYLDEPTIGLDSESKQRIREFIREMNEERKTTFIVTSHDFQDIEALCGRIILINHGRIVIDDAIGNVRKEFTKSKQIRFELDCNPWKDGRRFEVPGTKVLAAGEYELLVEHDVTETDSMSVIQYVSANCEMKDVSITGQDIETIVRGLIRRDNSG